MGAEPQSPERCAVELAKKLQASNRKIVFAESCTCGQVAAWMGQIPGISSVLCGSAVTYRNDSKTRWLSVKEDTLRTHSAESRQATVEMVSQVLEKTPEADVAAAITGHLGPDVDPEVDGVIFLAAVLREDSSQVRAKTVKLTASDRIGRQQEAARELIRWTFLQL